MNPSRSCLGRAVALLLTSLLVPVLAAPVSADLGSRLRGARAELARLERTIARDEAAANVLAGQVASLDAQLSAVEAKVGALTAQLSSLRSQIARSQALLQRLQERFDQMARESYMEGGDPLSTYVGIVFGSTSMSDLSDRLTFADSLASENRTVVDELQSAKVGLSRKAADVGALQRKETELSGQLQRQRQEKLDAMARQREVLGRLGATRSRIVALVARIKKQLRAEELAQIGAVFQGSAHVTYGRWAELFLGTIGTPACHANMVVMVSWQLAEFTQAAWNPLATTHAMPGSTVFNGAGVQDFVSLEQGLSATRATLEDGWTGHRYGAIVSSLRSCSDPMATADAINASDWCAGCAGGSYVTDDVPKVEADYSLYAAL